MKLLLLEWKSFGNDDIKDAFQELGHTVLTIPFNKSGLREDPAEKQTIIQNIQSQNPDAVFSFNFFPVIALACKETSTPYISWIYDSPYVLMYSYTIIFPTNYIFVFDKSVYQEFHNANIPTVYYLPLAANTSRLCQMTNFTDFQSTPWYNKHDIAFVGSLYTEKHQFFQRLDGIKPYTHGYLEGLMKAQLQIQGYNFIQELLPPDIITDMQKVLPLRPSPDGVETIEYLFAQYVINRQITATERIDLLTEIAKIYSLDLYTPDANLTLEGCTNHGAVDYYDFAPYVFKTAKINLNISLRSITSGIPLRAFDIMGVGGFLLTNFQADFLDYFIPDEDFVYYENKEDLLEKIDYYLTHDDIRRQIAKNGYEKVKQYHTYKHRVEIMLDILRQ